MVDTVSSDELSVEKKQAEACEVVRWCCRCAQRGYSEAGRKGRGRVERGGMVGCKPEVITAARAARRSPSGGAEASLTIAMTSSRFTTATPVVHVAFLAGNPL
jgi:hypothetical protein